MEREKYQNGKLSMETVDSEKSGTSVDDYTVAAILDTSKHSTYSLLINNTDATNSITFIVEGSNDPDDSNSWIPIDTEDQVIAGESTLFNQVCASLATRIKVKNSSVGNDINYKILVRLNPILVVF